jgi:Delta7-sterol 5-desaturase
MDAFWNKIFLTSTKSIVDPLYFLYPQVWKSPLLVSLFAGSVFTVVFMRYFLMSVGYQLLTARIFGKSPRLFNRTSRVQWKREVKWSIVSATIFTILTTGCLWLYQQGFTKIYDDFEQYSIGYFSFTIVIMLIGYETYYYWLHRWMHLPGIFRIVHKVHHDSVETSVFTSFSFHPIEALLQFMFLPLFVILIPVHYYALAIVLTLWTISAVINHASVEIFPKKFHRHRIGRWLIGATHHDLHHKEFKTNYGLYFTFWDKWMKTESRNFNSRFEANTRDGHMST